MLSLVISYGVIGKLSNIRFVDRVTDRLKAVLLGRVGFFCNGHYDISINKSNLTWSPNSDAISNKWVVIVGRGHYFESVRDYPIGHLGDLKQVLKNEAWRFPYQGLLLNKIERLSENSHRITSWVIRPEVLEGFSRRPILIIPESECLAHAAAQKIVVLQRLDETLYISAAADGLVSSLGHQSMFLDKVGKSATTLAGELNAGVLRFVEPNSTAEVLKGLWGMLKLVPLHLFGGVDLGSLRAYSWGQGMSLSALALFAYLSLTSLYLVVANIWVDHQLKADRDQAELSLQSRQNISINHARANAMGAAIADIQPLWVAWDVVLDLQVDGVIFRAINSNAAGVTFFITAKKATAVLERLSQDERVQNAVFVQPVRTVKGLEQTALLVSFRPAPPLNIDKNTISPASLLPTSNAQGQDVMSHKQTRSAELR